MQQSRDDRSLGELFGDLMQQTGTLVRQEMKLATTELSDKASRVGKDIGSLAVGGAVAYAGFLAIIAAIIVGLGQLGLTWWLSALIVGVVVAAIGAFLVQKGLTALKHQNMAPQQTIATLKEDQAWVKEQI
jgi:hypothetical protein